MTLRKIATVGHPVLRQKARAVTREELATDVTQAFIDDLVETMRDARGAGLAAIQVYEPIRICVLEVEKNPRYPYAPRIPLTILVNPELEPIGDERFDNYEGCLSVPNLRGLVSRNAQVRVRAWDRTGRPLDFVAAGISAGVYQHEVDHLDGVIFLDRVTDTTTLCTWEHFDRYRREAFIERIEPFIARHGG